MDVVGAVAAINVVTEEVKSVPVVVTETRVGYL